MSKEKKSKGATKKTNKPTSIKSKKQKESTGVANLTSITLDHHCFVDTKSSLRKLANEISDAATDLGFTLDGEFAEASHMRVTYFDTLDGIIGRMGLALKCAAKLPHVSDYTLFRSDGGPDLIVLENKELHSEEIALLGDVDREFAKFKCGKKTSLKDDIKPIGGIWMCETSAKLLSPIGNFEFRLWTDAKRGLPVFARLLVQPSQKDAKKFRKLLAAVKNSWRGEERSEPSILRELGSVSLDEAARVLENWQRLPSYKRAAILDLVD